jgi:hypothetical protein
MLHMTSALTVSVGEILILFRSQTYKRLLWITFSGGVNDRCLSGNRCLSWQCVIGIVLPPSGPELRFEPEPT